MNKYKEQHIKLIKASGGEISENLFVEKVGVVLTKKSEVTKEAISLFDIMNIDTAEEKTAQHAEFNSRITYLSFKDEENCSSKEYNKKMIQEYGHRSIYNDQIVSFLIAGSSLETMIELMAHNEATVARLTSSKTRSQDETLYRIRRDSEISDEVVSIQKTMIKKIEEERRKILNSNILNNEIEKEVFNMLNFGCKAISFTITMSIKDWHKTLIGRLSSHGVESEVIEVLSTISDLLNVEYPLFFNKKEQYFSMKNEVKYEQK